MPRVIGETRNGVLDGFLDITEEINFILGAEGDGHAISTRPAGATDTVDVGFRFIWQIVVHDQSHIFHIHAARRDIGGNENGHESLFETGERLFTLGLRLVSMNRLRGVSGGGECFGNLVRTVLGAVENNRKLRRFGFGLFIEKLLQQIHLVAAIYETEPLLDTLCGRHFRSDGNTRRIAQDGFCQLYDVRSQCSGKEQRLFFLWEHRDDAFHIAEKAHVEHAIHFIENEKLNRRKIDMSLVDQIQQPTRRGDKNIDTIAHRGDLWILANASIDQSLAETNFLTIGGKAFPDLDR